MQATLADFQAYRKARLEPADDAPRKAITSTSWNRHVTALESLYKWAVEEGLILKTPFRHKLRVGPASHAFGPVAANTLKDSHYREEKTRYGSYVRHDRYRMFRDMGLRCVGEDGLEDSRPHAARQAHRNVVLADLLYLTGLRIQEGGSLLEWDIPSPSTLIAARSMGAIVFVVPEGIAKGGKRREITVGLHALRQVQRYVSVERANLIDRHIDEAGKYTGIKDPILVRREDEKRYRIVRTGQVRVIAKATPDRRAKFVEVGPDGRQRPVALWLGDRGAPLALTSWEDAFEEAEKRSGVYVRPHMLRHSYAVNLLSRLVGSTMKAVKEDQLTDFGKVVRRLYAEPLNVVRRQLGHASITQTYQYLDCLEEAQMYVNTAVANLDEILTDIPLEALHAHG